MSRVQEAPGSVFSQGASLAVVQEALETGWDMSPHRGQAEPAAQRKGTVRMPQSPLVTTLSGRMNTLLTQHTFKT